MTTLDPSADHFAAKCPRVVTIGPERFWDQAGEWALGTGTFQIVRTLGDHASQHSLYAVVDAPLPAASSDFSALAPCYALIGVSALVIGSGFSSLPSTAARLRVQTAARGVLISQSDQSASTGALNTAHTISVDATAAPLAFSDPTDPILIEFDGAFGGSGWGTLKFAGVQIKFVQAYTRPAGSWGVGGAGGDLVCGPM